MPRAGVTKEKIFDVAEKIAAREGYARVNLGSIAREFGIQKPSLYKHVSSLAEIQDALAARGLQGLYNALREATDEAPAEGVNKTKGGRAEGAKALRAAAFAYRRCARENPGLYAAFQATHVKRGRETQEIAQKVLTNVVELLKRFGIPDESVIHAARSLRSLLHGFVSLEMEDGFGLPEDVEESFAIAVERWLLGWKK